MSRNLEQKSDKGKGKRSLFKDPTELDAFLLDNCLYDDTTLEEEEEVKPPRNKKVKLLPHNSKFSLANFGSVKLENPQSESVPELFSVFAPSDKLFDCPVFNDKMVQIQKLNKNSGYASPYENVAFQTVAETCTNAVFPHGFDKTDTRLAQPTHNLFLKLADQMCHFGHHMETSIKSLEHSQGARDPKIREFLEQLSNQTHYLGATTFYALGRASLLRKAWVFHELCSTPVENTAKTHAAQQLSILNPFATTKDDITFTGIKLFDYIAWTKEKQRGELLAQKANQISHAGIPSFKSNYFSNDRNKNNSQQNNSFNRSWNSNRDKPPTYDKTLSPEALSCQKELISELQGITGKNGSILDMFAPNLVSEKPYNREYNSSRYRKN